MSPRRSLDEALRVYVITSADFGRGHLEIAEAALDAGVRCIQFREKRGTTREMLHTARAVRELTWSYDALFIVNDRVDIAYAADADGVHLGKEDMPLTIARDMLGDAIIGISVDDEREAREAEEGGADYVGAGPVFPTGTKEGLPEPMGVEGIRKIASAVRVPVVGIGGITGDNAPQVIRAGATGVAVVSYIAAADDPREAAKRLIKVVMEALE